MPDDDEGVSPLDEQEAERAAERVAVGPQIVWEAIRLEGEEALRRSSSALFWSGLAAGLSMGFSHVVEALLKMHLPESATWTPLISKLGYTTGFVVVVLGRQQLFTETTLTAVLPLLARRNRPTALNMIRLWGVVLASNLIGALLFATVAARTGLFDQGTRAALATVAAPTMGASFGNTMIRGIFGGWLIALMVWLLPSAEQSRLWVIALITYLVGLGSFSHVIAGSVKVLYLVVLGHVGIGEYAIGFLAPALLGNTIGGVALVAALNHAQVIAGRAE